MEKDFLNKVKDIIANVNNLPEESQELVLESQPMSGIRKAISKAMSHSNQTNAAFTGMRNIDITKVFDLRNDVKDEAKNAGVKLTYLAFIAKASAMALEKMPNVNVRIDEENKSIIVIKNINIGIAVDTPKGLFVPVIRDCNKLSVFQIAQKIDELAIKARDGKLGMKDMKDGTFTISNYGAIKLDYATPVINSPESAILGVGNITKMPIYDGENIIPAYMMPFSMTADHRVIDGADVGRFLMEIEQYFKNPELLF